MKLLLIGVLGFALEVVSAAVPGSEAQTNRAVVLDCAESAAGAEKEFQALQAADDAAQAEVEKWARENDALKAKGGGMPQAEIDRRIRERMAPVQRAYTDFLSRHPRHARAHLAYGNFLNDRQDETGAQAEWEKALELDPKDPAAWHNLAGRYCETGQAKKAFEYFAKAIELGPREALYYHSFADALYVVRKAAMDYYGLTEQQVYAKALGLYREAVRLEPRNFGFASDLAQTYYALKPLPVEDALRAWTNAFPVAQNERERQSVSLHLARVKMLAGRLAEARAELSSVTNEQHLELKASLLRSIAEREGAGQKK